MLHEITRTQTHNRPGRAWAIGLLAAALLLTGCESQADKDKKAADAAYREKLAKAQAIFAERCKTAGVVIHRTVKDVEGIELKKIRPKLEFGDKRYFDPMFEGAAMAGGYGGASYVKQFLLYEFPLADTPNVRGALMPMTIERRVKRPNARNGYTFVEYIDETSKKRNRCKADWSLDHPNSVEGQLHCEVVVQAKARYALDYEDLVDKGDRAYWVAGTKLRVIDLSTNEVLAEFTRYAFDPGFGTSSTGKWPWQYASLRTDLHCPSKSLEHTGNESRYFVDSVLIPKQGD